jgi:tRNA wybutosine-synthesizing protein 4
MLKKRDVVQKSNELTSMLTNVEQFQTGDVLLRSDQYVQLGCDLRELDRLNDTLSRVIDIETSTIIFVAEVSITYMDIQASDALIQWASGLSEGNKLTRSGPSMTNCT